MLKHLIDSNLRSQRTPSQHYLWALALMLLANSLEMLLSTFVDEPTNLVFFGFVPLITIVSGFLPAMLMMLLDMMLHFSLGHLQSDSSFLELLARYPSSFLSIASVLEVILLSYIIDMLMKIAYNKQVMQAQLITEQIQSLKNAQERLSIATQSSGVGTWEWQIKTNRLDWDAQMFVLYDVNQAEFDVSFTGWMTCILPEDHARIKAEADASLLKGAPYDTSFRIRDQKGEIRHIRAKATVLRDETGQPLRMIGTNWDNTQRVKQSAELRLLQTAINRIDDVIIITDAEPIDLPGPRIVYVNDAFERVTGFTRAEAIGQSPRILQGIDSDRAELNRFRASLETWQGGTFRIKNYPKVGEPFWAEIVVSVITNEDGWHTHWVSVQRDITERKHIELKLKSSESKLRGLYDHAPIGITLRKKWDGVFIETNQYFQKMLGYSAAELLTLTSAALTYHLPGSTSASESESESESELGSTKSINSFSVDKCYQHKNGSLINVRLYSVQIIRENESYIWTMVENITDALAIEQNLQQSKVLAEQALAIKTQFLANMSHEIRTPMNGIMGLTSLALELEINDEVRSYLNYINESAQSLLIVVNDILDFSKIEAGKLAIELLPFSLRGLLNNLQGLFKATTDQKGLALSFKLANTSPDMLIGDVFRLQQILNNLIGNAIKFTASGKIDFNVSVLPRLPEQESDQVRLLFSITDTGIGISDEEKGHLLHPFSQVDSSISRRYGGSGLGLTITQQLLKLMGSELQINSVKGVGSTFSFEIFLVIDDSEAKAPERLPVPIKVVAPIIETSPEDDLNTSELMISLDNDQVLANELFSLFIQTALPHLDDIAKEISQQNYQAAHHLVHDLKGSASTLGAKNLQQAAQQLDNALRHNQFEPALFDEFKRQLLKAMRAIENLLEAQSKIQPVETLPVESADDSQAVESADDLRERNHALADKYILVAEDNHFAQLAVKELLQLFGARVDVVPNGKLALERLAEQHYDVVLMDLHMPVMDGAEATTKIRSQVQFANLPIIAFSADDSDYERANCLALGMNDAIVKGSNSEKLVQLLCYWIEKNSPSVSAEPETSPTVVAIADTVNPPAPTAKAPTTPLLAKKNLITKVSSLDLKGVIAMADSLASADGKDDLIKQLLQAFYDDTRSALQDIAEYFEHEHFQEPRRIVHSIKGSAGILGAHKLQNSAAKLNYSLNSGKIDQLAYQDFQDDLIETRDMIAKLLG